MFNKQLDLTIFINTIKNIHATHGVLFLFFMLSLWILLFVSLVTIRKVLIKEIIKFYLSLFYYYGYFKSKYYKYIYDRYYTSSWFNRKISVYLWEFTKKIIN